ncbi:MAG TPA: four helix bundle protein [Chitinophagaceae bacterium]|nr:four helix bundle protein [Chitinophagaceae bacterium]
MDRKELEDRTKQFHINVIRLCNGLSKTAAGFEIAKQVIRSAGSVGANYRATKRAKSTNDFINKLKIIIEEADESLYWLEVIRDIPLLNNEKVNPLIQEANELVAIFVSALKTMSQNKNSN